MTVPHNTYFSGMRNIMIRSIPNATTTDTHAARVNDSTSPMDTMIKAAYIKKVTKGLFFFKKSKPMETGKNIAKTAP